MRAVYRYFLAYAERGKLPAIPLLAERARLLDAGSRSKLAVLQLTHDVIRDDFRMDPPAIGRLRNIVNNYPENRAPLA